MISAKMFLLPLIFQLVLKSRVTSSPLPIESSMLQFDVFRPHQTAIFTIGGKDYRRLNEELSFKNSKENGDGSAIERKKQIVQGQNMEEPKYEPRTQMSGVPNHFAFLDAAYIMVKKINKTKT